MELQISKQVYDIATDLLVSRIKEIIDNEDRTLEEIEELRGLMDAKKEFDIYAEDHNNAVLDRIKPCPAAGDKEEGK